MDLQARIAARRREMAAQKREAEEAAEAHVAKLAARLDAEAESSVMPALADQKVPPGLDGEVVDRQIEKLIEKEAQKLMSADGGLGWFLCFFGGLALCLITWHGLWLTLVGLIWFSLKQSQYKDLARKKVEALSRDLET